MAKIKNTISKNLPTKIACFFIISLAGILLYIGLQIYTDSMYQYYSHVFLKGQISESNLLVNDSMDILDEEATINKRNENARNVLPVFTYSLEDSLRSIKKYDSLKQAIEIKDYSTVANLCGSEVSAYVSMKDSSLLLSVCYEIISDIVDSGVFNADDISRAIGEGYSYVCFIKNGKELNLNLKSDVITNYNIFHEVNEKLLSYEKLGLTLSDSSIIQSIISSLICTNVSYDENYTAERRKRAVEETEPIYISFEKGQVLLAKDHVITDEQLALIKLIGNSSKVTVSQIIGESSFILLTMFFSLFLFCFFLDSEKYHIVEFLWVTTISLLITCVIAFFTIQKATKLGVSFVECFIPICFAPVLITMLTGKRSYGYIVSFIVGILISAIPGSTYLTIIYCSISGVLSCYVVRFFNKRTDMIIQWLISLVVTSLLCALFAFIGSYSNKELLWDLIGNALCVSVTQVMIFIFLPVIEKIFNLPTVFRLNELAYGNNPLLTKLADVAPGTYSHSKMVAELAESASKAIDSNALLARVGGLYHDIGKIEHPEYFVENEAGTNKHQDLNPGLSVAIIKSHVKVGADKGRESGLPAELIDIIANHHGNDVISYFFNEAKKQADEDDVVSSTDYSYSGASIPETRECAIVMLADSVEAAARTVSEPTTAKFTKLINTIVFGKIERGQLDNCDISLKEIDTIKESFLKTLSALYHSRIEYPDEVEDK